MGDGSNYAQNSVIYKLKLPRLTCPATQCFHNISSGLNQTMFNLHEILVYETKVLKAETNTLKADVNSSKAETNALKAELESEKAKNAAETNALKADVQASKAETNALKAELASEITKSIELNNTIVEPKSMVQTLAQQYASIHQECK